ncbi:hypothetical protein [Krasilnikovia sp. MM14-A1259]|uniref:hypothetical protein n=1 Tax=Krasilnikovia sp. MM14-A1259 TaxID=3373539 RepID=UPI00380C64EA
MLTRRLLTALTVLVVAQAVAATPALANPPGGCSGPDCTVVGDVPGDPGGGGDNNGGGGGAGGGGGCHYQGKTVPCSIPSLGFFNAADGCYYLVSPPPPPGGAEEPPAGEQGNWYTITCNGEARLQWVPGAPIQAPPDPEVLARRALAKITLKGADIGMAPAPGKAGLVNLPAWMWTTVTANTWGPISASDTEAGLTVTITARAQSITWDMGDGHSVTCTGPGTPFRAGNGGKSSPTCGYTYPQSSRNKPGGKYTVTATTDWRVDWDGGGVTGVIDQTRTSQTTVRIDELQVVN